MNSLKKVKFCFKKNTQKIKNSLKKVKVTQKNQVTQKSAQKSKFT